MNSSTKPLFIQDEQQKVFKKLREEVNQFIKENQPSKQKAILFKAILFPCLYIFIYLSALIWGHHIFILYSCYFFLGFLIVIVFLNVIHDAVHETIFRNRKLNRLYVYFFDLMGANSFMWKNRHVRYHHNYPNVNGWDTDIEQSKLFRVFPDGKFSRFHKYQHIYLPLLYPFYLANWLLVRDFKDYFDKRKTVRKLISIPKIEYVKLFCFKILFICYLVVIPKIILHISLGKMLLAFAIMLFTASLFSLLVLLSPHANADADFPETDTSNHLPHGWMMHMMTTTNDVKHDNWFTRFFMGCFNYHVAHHLFPNVNHMYYPDITVLLKKYSQQYHLPYRQYTLLYSLKSHYRLLKKNRLRENIFEESM